MMISVMLALFLGGFALMPVSLESEEAFQDIQSLQQVRLSEEEREMLERDAVANEGDILTIGLSQIGSESDWRIASTASVQACFSSRNGYDLIFDDAQQKQENQLKAIREFIDQDVDYIILDPCVETGWDSVLKEAKEAGIPVIVYDRRVDVSDEGLYVAWVGSDFRLEGDRACAWLREFLKSKNMTDSIGIVDLQGTLGASAQIGRTEALEAAVRENEGWNLIAQESGDFTEGKGQEVMRDLLNRLGDKIDVVYCENDNMAYGAINALKEKGYTVGTDLAKGDKLVLSFDATRNGLKLTLDGGIAVNTECSPLYGPILTDMVVKLDQGQALAHDTYIEEGQFSALSYIGSIRVSDRSYPVTALTEDLIRTRTY
ncbi:MAG: ABC transporter substrate-binding protein [Lachnospiraceae bacterium]|nr:ABC transporter substrate-binding protein [Lachnospiraceae bacterium]